MKTRGVTSLSDRAVSSTSHIKAVLGPTNTGKTHLAVERMLAHSTGMIGLPLRLLAREVYDRVVTSPQNPGGKNSVALITGEEKIIPRNPRWWVCTVESMPVDKTVAFLAIDEIQLAADMDRGHVFTDRLLRARGTQETMFLGSSIIGPLIRRFVPDVEFSVRPRFSELIYTDPKKLSRLNPRTALVTFSAHNVYGYAEMLRRQKGGVAVVMGSLSPRTRNKQVELYQNGDVDFLVATDAIGMGLNMDIDHVCFASTSKFDGRRMRSLTASELAQIAGRAGRYMNNGTFGCLQDGADDQAGLSDEMISAVENHDFAPLTVLQWRNSALDFSHPTALIRSLDAAPGRKGLSRTLENIDLTSLRQLINTPDIRSLLGGPAALKNLWEVCQIPDFRRVSDDEHIRLLGQIYRQTSADSGTLGPDWLAGHITPLDRTDGDVDTLSARIAHIRTWTYISHRASWFDDAKYWQELTRDIEDRLSDALHERLTHRFVDRRMSVLMRELRQKGRLMANIDTDGSIYVEGHFIGTLEGFQFKEDPAAYGEDSKVLRAAADQVLSQEIKTKADELAQAEDGELSLILGDPMTRSNITWRGIVIARVEKGSTLLVPKAVVTPTPVLQGDVLSLVQARVDRWLNNHVAEVLAPLFALQEAVNGAKDTEGKELIDGMARGIAFQMLEKLGTIPRRMIARDFRGVEREGRFQMKQLGIWLGSASLYIPSLLKPAPAQLRLFLWALFNDMDRLPEVPVAGLCTITIDQKAPRSFYEVSGYRVVGKNAVRLDMLERLANAARDVSLKGPFPADPDLMSLVGTSGDDFVEIMSYLGYVNKEYSPEEAAKIAETRSAKEAEKAEAEKAEKAEKAEAEKTEKAPDAETVDAKPEATEAPKEEVKEEVKAEEAPQEEAKAEEVKVEETPVEEAKVEETPAIEVKTEDTPAEEVKVEAEGAKAEEAPVEPEKVFLFSHQPYQKAQQRGPRKPFAGGPKGQADGASFKGKRGVAKGNGAGGKKFDGKKSSGHKPNHKSGHKPGRKAVVLDPHSPFAALAGLKDQLKSKK
ncbi:MAG: disulfide oxidoreductase [Alphaproteobacteria bacterium]|nr:MAG: disulfide oxidoreductase [Alphaproteobacteria bacterium]